MLVGEELVFLEEPITTGNLHHCSLLFTGISILVQPFQPISRRLFRMTDFVGNDQANEFNIVHCHLLKIKRSVPK